MTEECLVLRRRSTARLFQQQRRSLIQTSPRILQISSVKLESKLFSQDLSGELSNAQLTGVFKVLFLVSLHSIFINSQIPVFNPYLTLTLTGRNPMDFEVFQKYRQTSAAVLACSPAGDTASIFGTTHSRILILTRVAPRIGFC